jgi:hypothetical protein
MKIEIEIKTEANRQVEIELHLLNELMIVDAVDFAEEHKLSEKLLSSVDELLKKNNLQIGDIGEMTLKSSLDEAFTTYRIAKSVVDAFNYAKRA